MSNKSNEEYTFENEPSTMKEEYSESSHRNSTESVMSIVKNPRVILPVVAIVVFYFGSSIFKSEDKAPEPEVVVDIPKPFVEAPAPVVQKVDPVPMKIIDNSAPLKESIGSIEGVVQSQQSDINNLNNSVKQINYQLNGLSQELQRVSNQMNVVLSKLDRPKVVVKQKKKVKKIYKKEHYFIKAMVSGRAWVRDLNNKTHTVAVGDSLPRYGKVTGIYPDEGFISTESGNVIKFSKYAN